METWEIYDAAPDEIKIIREWARTRPVVTERGENRDELLRALRGQRA
jgi:hypothetical protein